MKVCHVNLARRFSGAERQTLQLIKQQLREGYKLTVIARNNTPFAKEVEKLPCLLITTRSVLLKQSSKLNKLDLIHAHDEQGAQWAYLQHLRYNSPYIITRRVDQPFANKHLSPKIHQNAKALVGLSSTIVNSLQEKFANQHCLKIPSSPVSYPVNQNKVDQIWSAHGHKFLVLQASHLGKKKGFDITIQAAKLLEEKNLPIHFLLLGSGPEKDNLEKQAAGLSNVFFLGNQEDMGTWFASANVLVQPSRSEGLGTVILEAIAAGLTVIASRIGDIPEIIEHETSGLLIEPGNAEELATEIERLATNQDLGNRLQANAKDKLHKFDITHTSKLYKQLYSQILDKTTIEKR